MIVGGMRTERGQKESDRLVGWMQRLGRICVSLADRWEGKKE